MYGIADLILVKCGFPEFPESGGFSKAPVQLHFKMQVIHIRDVLGGGAKPFRPEQTIEELNMAAKKKAAKKKAVKKVAKKAVKKVAKKKATKKKAKKK